MDGFRLDMNPHYLAVLLHFLRKIFVSVAAKPLSSIHGNISTLDQIFQLPAMFREKHNTDTGCYDNLLCLYLERDSHNFENLFGPRY